MVDPQRILNYLSVQYDVILRNYRAVVERVNKSVLSVPVLNSFIYSTHIWRTDHVLDTILGVGYSGNQIFAPMKLTFY